MYGNGNGIIILGYIEYETPVCVLFSILGSSGLAMYTFLQLA